MDQIHVEDDFCGATKAAKMLMVSVGTVHKLIQKGELVAWKTEGGHRRIEVQSLRNYLMRRGRLLSSHDEDAQKLKISFLLSDESLQTQLKRKAMEWGLNVKPFFHTHVLDAILALSDEKPDVFFIQARLLKDGGQLEWLRSLRKPTALRDMGLLLLCEPQDKTVELSALALSCHVELLDAPLNVGWLSGYINALLSRGYTASPLTRFS